jgi:hypothetical protein
MLAGRAWAATLAVLVLGACADGGTEPASIASLELDRTALSLELGDSTQINVTARDAAGEVLVGRVLTWTSSDPATVRVTSGGLITGLAPGLAQIIVRAGGHTVSADITVHDWNIADNVLLIDSSRVNLVSDSAERAAGRLRFQVIQDPPPVVSPGTIVVGAQNGGFLRRVVSASAGASSLTLETEPAALSDVIEKGGFATRIDLLFGPATPAGALPAHADDIAWGEGRFTYLAPGFTPNGAGFDVSGANICQLLAAATLGGSTCPSQVSKFLIKTGRLDFSPTLDTSAEWNGFALEEFRLVAEGALDLDVALEFEITNSLASFTPDVTFFKFTRPFYWQIGVVPVLGYAELVGKGVLSLKATAKGAMLAGIQAGGMVEIGAEWDAASGWNGIADYQGNFIPQSPSVEDGTLKAQIQIEAKVAMKPRLQFIFYGVIGPFAEVEPFGKATLNFGTQSCGLSAALGINAAVGFTIPFLDSKVADFSTSWNDPNPLVAGPSQSWSCPLGQLDIRTITNGQDIDPDGYQLLLDTEAKGAIGTNAAVLLQFVEKGTREVALDGVAHNCSVQGGPTRTVTVGTAGSTQVDFIIHCLAQGGDIAVTTATGGQLLDPDGYTVTLDNGTAQSIPINGSVTFAGVPAGAHTVTLSGVAPNCSVPANPLAVNVAGVTVTAAFQITCSAAQLVVRTQTNGPPASSAWSVTMDASETQPIAPNGQAVFTTSAGVHVVTLNGVPTNCQVTSANPASADVPASGQANIVFTVTCQAAGITVNVSTAGDPGVPNYTAHVIGSQSQAIPINGSVNFANLAAATYSVQLNGIPSHCTVQGLNPQSVTAPGSVSFQVTCQQPVQCTGAPTPLLGDSVLVLPRDGGTHVTDVVRKSWGDLETFGSSSTGAGKAGPDLVVMAWSYDWLQLTPVDATRAGEAVTLRVHVVGSIDLTAAGSSISSGRVNMPAAKDWLRRSDVEGTGTLVIDEFLDLSLTLGQWSSNPFGFDIAASALSNDGTAASSRVSARVNGLVDVRDAGGNIVPIAAVCTASGTAY